jgi:hypothetical protein
MQHGICCHCCFLLLGIKTTVIHPATEKHIRKYQSQEVHLIEETPELYKSVTLPHLQKEKFSLQVNIEVEMVN